MDGVVRDAGASDVAGMVEIYAPVVAETAISFESVAPGIEEFAERLGRIQATDPWLVLEVDGQIVGYAYSSPFKARPAYEGTRETTVYVHHDHRGGGVGRRLMSGLLERLIERGDHLAVAFVTLPNEASIRLHERIGFDRVGTLIEAGQKFGRWHDVGIWQRRLGADD